MTGRLYSFVEGAAVSIAFRTFAKPRSVAMKRKIIGAMSRVGSTAGCPDWRPKASP